MCGVKRSANEGYSVHAAAAFCHTAMKEEEEARDDVAFAGDANADLSKAVMCSTSRARAEILEPTCNKRRRHAGQ